MSDDYDELTVQQPLDYDDFFDDIDGSGTIVSRPCLDCGKAFPTNGLLEIHRQKVHEDPPLLVCTSCNVDFKRKMGLITHWRTAPSHRRNDGVKLVGCDICDAFNIVNGFRDEAAVESHTKHVHGEHVLVNTADQAKSYCPLCRSEFAYRKGMIEHLQVLHGEHLLTELLGVTGSEKDRLMEDLQFKCPACSKVFRVKKSLNQHMEKMHGTLATSLAASPQPRSPRVTPIVVPASVIISSPKVPKVTAAPRSVVASPPAAKIARTTFTPIAKQPDISSSNTQVTCPVCLRTFTRQSVLNVHTQMVHGTAPMSHIPGGKSTTNHHATSSPDETYDDSLVDADDYEDSQ